MWQECKQLGLSNLFMLLLLLVAAVLSFGARAQQLDDDLGLLAPVPESSESELSAQIETLQQALVKLNRDLFILEEDLLFPSSTQVAVYLSMDVGNYFDLDAIEVKIGDETVTHYLYTDNQVNALVRGGVHRVYVGNIGQGEHQLDAFFHGIGPEQRPYKRAVSLKFEKTDDPKAIELQIIDSTMAQQPEFIALEL